MSIDAKIDHLFNVIIPGTMGKNLDNYQHKIFTHIIINDELYHELDRRRKYEAFNALPKDYPLIDKTIEIEESQLVGIDTLYGKLIIIQDNQIVMPIILTTEEFKEYIENYKELNERD